MYTDPANQTIDELKRQLQRADLQTPLRKPWIPSERDEILAIAKKCLGIREEWIPRITPTPSPAISGEPVSIHKLSATSWPGCYCAAHLYVPEKAANEKLPLVILCCGHGKEGKQTEGYRRMAWQLAAQGSAVLIPDNIGQGERAAMGHARAVAPFRCGTSLQGLIVMETMGWLRWALADNRFDKEKIAAIGNSGGGTLTLFLGALCRDQLAVLSSSGYPSTFDFIAAKEKNHCHCNILPGVMGNLWMWQLYGCFAPKPLYLFQGKCDSMFPVDLFHVVCRKTAHAYERSGHSQAFKSAVFPGAHSWDDTRRESLAAFLTEHLGLNPVNPSLHFPEEVPENCYPAWPINALSTDALASQITSVPAIEQDDLYKIYLPDLETEQDRKFPNGSFKQIAAQLQAFLNPEMIHFKT